MIQAQEINFWETIAQTIKTWILKLNFEHSISSTMWKKGEKSLRIKFSKFDFPKPKHKKPKYKNVIEASKIWAFIYHDMFKYKKTKYKKVKFKITIWRGRSTARTKALSIIIPFGVIFIASCHIVIHTNLIVVSENREEQCLFMQHLACLPQQTIAPRYKSALLVAGLKLNHRS